MRRLLATTLPLLPACGAPSPSVSSTTGAETDYGPATMGVGPGLDVDGEDGASRCQAEIAALSPHVTEPEGGCSVIVRLHGQTLALLGYQTVCAPYEPLWLDEAEARDLTECCADAGTVLNPPHDDELWVFHVPPADFGHVAVVSNHVTQRLFEATIVWDGAGELVYPDLWLEPDALGSECGATPRPEITSYDLAEGGVIATERLDEIWDVVGSTALPLAMSVVGEPRRVVALYYPRSVGLLDPSTAEVVVVIEGGIARDRAPEPPSGATG